MIYTKKNRRKGWARKVSLNKNQERTSRTKMKKEQGMGLITIILTIIVIIGLAIWAFCNVINKTKENKVVDIEANMLLIKGKCEILEKTSKVNNNTDNLKGKKLSEMRDDSIISDFINKGFIEEDKLEKYYALSDEDLSEMELDVKNEKKSYYVVSYEEETVFITKGYKKAKSKETIYKLEE